MSENKACCQNDKGLPKIREAVCIDTNRVYDSCADKDCLADLRVYFPPQCQEIVEHATNVRCRGTEILNVFMDVEKVPFNRGCYSVDITFFFKVTVEVYSVASVPPTTICGFSTFSKKCILYGSEGNVKMFSSDGSADEIDSTDCKVLPKATVQVAQPIALSARICDGSPCGCESCCRIPECICSRYGGEFETGSCPRTVYATIGLFIIVQIVRNVQMLIPAYDFCIPEKECEASSDNPCELVRRIEFPTDEFFPPKAGDCGCSDRC